MHKETVSDLLRFDEIRFCSAVAPFINTHERLRSHSNADCIFDQIVSFPSWFTIASILIGSTSNTFRNQLCYSWSACCSFYCKLVSFLICKCVAKLNCLFYCNGKSTLRSMIARTIYSLSRTTFTHLIFVSRAIPFQVARNLIGNLPFCVTNRSKWHRFRFISIFIEWEN